MRFQPVKEEDLGFKLVDPDIYTFEVVYAEEKVSKAGNEYIFLKLKIWDKEGKERLVFTNLALIKLLKHFCDVAGLSHKYEEGEVHAEDCLCKSGLVEIGIEPGNEKPGGGYYPDKNVVLDYLLHAIPESAAAKTKETFSSDDIPF